MVIREIDIHDFFVKYLIENGYPENSINIDQIIYHPERTCKPDIIIVDPYSNTPLAIFELKKNKTEKTFSIAADRLIMYSRGLNNPDIPLYAVFPKMTDDKSLGFEFFTINCSDDNKKIDNTKKNEKPPDYKILKNSRLTKEISKISNEQEKTIDYFQIMCWISAIFVFFALLADIFNYIKIDLQRLSLTGVIVGLFILPYASRLKILGFEFERLTQIKKGER